MFDSPYFTKALLQVSAQCEPEFGLVRNVIASTFILKNDLVHTSYDMT
jgi:hypothetical protein